MKKKSYKKTFCKIFLITAFICIILLSALLIFASLGMLGDVDDIDISTIVSNNSSVIYYTDSKTNTPVELTHLSSEQNKIWVDFDKIPDNMKNAFVSIEDERFYKHSGLDIFRTSKAFFVYVYNKAMHKPTAFGGSTITQQLIKNITKRNEQTVARKVSEISLAVNLEKKLSKSQILELYLNSIYLAEGCNGVQAASKEYFGKQVNELNLAECASIAGITQYPTLYDPLINPDKNKIKQKLVLQKMLELGYITKPEYDDAINYELNFIKNASHSNSASKINSYFVDQIISDVLKKLKEKGYTDAIATKMLYSGGLHIYSTYDPEIQSAINNVYENNSNFYSNGSQNSPQSSIIIIDPYTGAIKGLAGGIGAKKGNLVLNRATQTLRQPGSTIKPLSVYSPAIENGLINAGSIYKDEKKDYNGWSPVNYDHKFNGSVNVRYAVKHSLNTIPVEILSEYGADKSFNHMVNDLGFTSLVRSEKSADGKVYSDIGLSQLALGGLTHGVSNLELTAAYSPYINDGIYTKPYTFTIVKDNKNNIIISTDIESHVALSKSTAYITSQLLREVVTSGTGAGSQLSNGMFTAGKTGTTSENNDRWFVGFTPYYVCGVWYGYDSPKSIPVSGNPCIPVWKKVMDSIHKNLQLKEPPKPSDVISLTYCSSSGRMLGRHCNASAATFYFTDNNKPSGYCSYSHSSYKPSKSNNNENELPSSTNHSTSDAKVENNYSIPDEKIEN